MINIINALINDKPTPNKIVVRVKTSYWRDNKGLHIRKDINYLKRKCEGFNFIEEDCSMVGFEEVAPKILNLNEVGDGVYRIIVTNETKNWETGYVDDWDYKLIEHKEDK